MKVCVGGTFDILHKGHRLLLERAFSRAGAEGAVSIGLTSDAFVMERKKECTLLRDYAERMESLCEFIDSQPERRNYEIISINTPFGGADRQDYDAIVVSAETENMALEINASRQKAGLESLEIISIGHVLAQDGIAVSSTRIRHGEIDGEGRLVGRLRVAVGSKNPVKVEAVKTVFQRVFPHSEVEALGVLVESGVGEQPEEEETAEGAKNRATRAIELEGSGKASFGVGIEAGLFWNESIGDYLDIQHCVIVDREERVTFGQGPGFLYPPALIQEVRDGASVGEAMEKLYGKNLGSDIGAVGFLSEGHITRVKLTEQAVLAALIPRIKEELYWPWPEEQ